jgi:hypothetical protein
MAKPELKNASYLWCKQDARGHRVCSIDKNMCETSPMQ